MVAYFLGVVVCWVGFFFPLSCKHNLHHQYNKTSVRRDLVGWLWSFCVRLPFFDTTFIGSSMQQNLTPQIFRSVDS